MPRLAHRLLSRARDISPFLPLLLRTCRTLPSARNELRWLTEYVDEKSQRYPIDWRQHNSFLTHLCEQRGRGVPLQYLLGSQPFGDLDILCRPGVLIPRFVMCVPLK
jgi:methylase of polypeptide subunit release factors